jgi:hypothetical protein
VPYTVSHCIHFTSSANFAMTNYQVRRQHGMLASDSQQLGKDEEDSNSTIEDSDEMENNPTSEHNRQIVQQALVGDMASGASHAGTSGTSHESEIGNFSIDEVREMVLHSIPANVRESMPPGTLACLFDEALDNVLSEGGDRSGKVATTEEIKDIVNLMRVFVKREARRKQECREVSEVTHPAIHHQGPPRSLDAVTLALSTVDYDQATSEDDESYDAHVKGRGRKAPSPKPDYTRVPSTKSIGSPISQPVPPPDEAVPTGDIREVSAKITFKEVDIRYYEQILSDNPAVSSGPPIGIGWRYRHMNKEITVDAWEERRQSNRRYLTGLMASRHERTNRLRELGYSKSDMAKSVREVMRIKNSRKKTFHNIGFEHVEEIIERTSKKFLNMLSLGAIKRREKQLLAPYLPRK